MDVHVLSFIHAHARTYTSPQSYFLLLRYVAGRRFVPCGTRKHEEPPAETSLWAAGKRYENNSKKKSLKTNKTTKERKATQSNV
jgi:hypothetical protein